ncbi:hypothetical protein T06_11595, partial [Trichinella sp. T6]
LEIPAHRQLSKSGRHFIWYKENLSTLSEHSVLSMDETLKIVLEWYQRLLTIHYFLYIVYLSEKISLIRLENIISDFETALIVAVQGSFPGVHVQGCYFHFFQAVLRTVADLELRTSGNKEKIKILMATAFLPLAEVPDAVDLLGRDVAGLLAALFDYF